MYTAQGHDLSLRYFVTWFRVRITQYSKKLIINCIFQIKMKINLKDTILLLWDEVNALHPNDPSKSDYWAIMRELLVIDKQATLAFIPTITDVYLLDLLTGELFYILDSFKCRKIAALWKQQILVFKHISFFDKLMEAFEESMFVWDWSFDYRFVRMHKHALWTFLYKIYCNQPQLDLYRNIVSEVLAICKRATAEIIKEIEYDFYMKEITIHIVYVIERFKNIQLLKVWKTQIDQFKNSAYYGELIGYYQLAQQALAKYYIVENDFKSLMIPKIKLSHDMLDEMFKLEGVFDAYSKILIQCKLRTVAHLEAAKAIQMRFLNHFKWLEPLHGDAWYCGLTYVSSWESGKRVKTFVETATFLLDEQTIWLSFRVNVFAIEVFEGIILSGERIPIEIGQHNRQRFNNSLESVARDAFFEIQSIRAATFERQMKEHGFIA
jgi:hypothetical protein